MSVLQQYDQALTSLEVMLRALATAQADQIDCFFDPLEAGAAEEIPASRLRHSYEEAYNRHYIQCRCTHEIGVQTKALRALYPELCKMYDRACSAVC